MMNLYLTHPNDRALQTHVDGESDSGTGLRIEAHLVECALCRARVAELDYLVNRVGSLLPALDPPVDLWPGIAERIGGDGGARVIPISSRRRVPSPRRAAGWIAAAAAVLVVGIGIGRSLPGRAEPIALEPTRAATPEVMVANTNRAYEMAIADLRGILESMRDELQPGTIATVEESLAVIDLAIAEAAAALAADPANDFLRRRISIYQQTGLDMLRAATGAAAMTDI